MNERQRLVGEALLLKRLRSLVRVDDDTYVDPNYVVHVEYQLFLDAKRAVGQYFQPDHWTSYAFSRGDARLPVVGVRPSDAVAFCKWLTQSDSQSGLGGWVFRLPGAGELTRSGIDSPAAQGTACGYWVTSKKDGVFESTDSLEMSVGNSSALIRSLALDCARDRNRNRDRDRALAHALASDLTLDRDRDLARDLERTHALDFDFDFDRARARALDLDLDRARARDLDRALALDRVRTLALALDRALARDLDRALALEDGRDRACDRACDRARDLTLTLTLALARGRDRALAYALDRARDIDRDIARDLDQKVVRHLMIQALDIYLDFVILELRTKGMSPAIEGIRIVKARQTGTP